MFSCSHSIFGSLSVTLSGPPKNSFSNHFTNSPSCRTFWMNLLAFFMKMNFGECGSGGWGGIRTHETLSRLPVFKTGAFNRSATHPKDCLSIGYFGYDRRSMPKSRKK